MSLTDELVKAKKKGKFRKRAPGANILPSKAKEMLKDGTAHGHALTDAQRRMLYWRAGDNKW